MARTTGEVRHRAGSGRVLAVSAVALLALSACAGESAGEIELERGESGMMPAIEPPGPEGFDSAEVGGVSIDAPDGWEVQNEGGQLCMTPPGQSACAYGSVQLVPKQAANHPQDWPKKGDAFYDDDGWADNTDSCRSLNTAASGNIGVDKATLTSDHGQIFEHADGLKSHHSVWSVTCDNDDTFEVRMWFLPESDVMLYVWSADAQYSAVYDEIAASMDTTEYRNAS
ncbi:MAG: hypothetical protein JK586_12340 [Nocardiopsis sp. BM-2018]|uniref:DUF3558 domain-containing protein n=1 Tax=Nocardiopsis metallicus TaxID=179819 RepID=A0A840WEZ4_9ACTN|nr:hypothetical protein [Nocardiopsis metallicus]MBB5495550.1 hypothetical protein [Nocardiopsis metallicus]QRN79140.1 MAG: hypothetical protein JK586_12340 [Nocardiopsis sp. BM-2018]